MVSMWSSMRGSMGRAVLACLCACGNDAPAGTTTTETMSDTSTATSAGSTPGPTASTSSASTQSTGSADTTGSVDPTTSTSDSGTTETDTEGEPVGTPFVYVGTYGSSIYVYELDIDSGALTAMGGPVDAGTNPSFLAVDPERRYLFAVNETANFQGMQTGAVASFGIDPATAALTFVDRVSSAGSGPAHVATDRGGKWVLVTNYGGGTAAVLPIEQGGMLGEAVDVESHGNGAQSHMIMAAPANDFVFVPNKGLDDVAQYLFDDMAGTLMPNAAPSVPLDDGAGPRHMDFHPSLDHAYLVGELDDTMRAYDYDPRNGRLTGIQTLGTLPGGFDGTQNTCADVHVHPAGTFVYGSNRGHDSIAIFEIDAGNGMLTFVGHQSTGGQTPRNFEISPGGELLLVANRDSDSIVAFHIDEQTGQLTPTGETTNVPSPSFVGIVYLPGR